MFQANIRDIQPIIFGKANKRIVFFVPKRFLNKPEAIQKNAAPKCIEETAQENSLSVIGNSFSPLTSRGAAGADQPRLTPKRNGPMLAEKREIIFAVENYLEQSHLLLQLILAGKLYNLPL